MTLNRLTDRGAYPQQGMPDQRWAQLLRQSSFIKDLLAAGRSTGSLVPLRDVAEIRGGVVTRANAYFLVTELDLLQVPNRFRLTKRDYAKIAVVVDGLDTAHRIEREHLRPVLKGPESLLSPTSADPGSLRVLNVTKPVSVLRKERQSGVVKYLKRGTEQTYDKSSDQLKGGIPAERSNVKNRSPYWYSLNMSQNEKDRIVVPEHIDRRYPATLLASENSQTVVLDKLYQVEPNDEDHALPLTIALNSILTWAQLEIRGRTQLGQGVLEVKKSDWEGVLVLDPERVDQDLRDAFAPISANLTAWDLGEVANEDRVAFDESYLRLLLEDPSNVRQSVELDVVSSASERSVRAASLREAQSQQKRQRRVATNVDAYAARIASLVRPYPDPRDFTDNALLAQVVTVSGDAQGRVTVGTDLFTLGMVLSDDVPIAVTDSTEAARFVQAVLVHDPDLEQVEVPAMPALSVVLETWDHDADSWLLEFEAALSESTAGIADETLRSSIARRARHLLHVPDA